MHLEIRSNSSNEIPLHAKTETTCADVHDLGVAHRGQHASEDMVHLLGRGEEQHPVGGRERLLGEACVGVVL